MTRKTDKAAEYRRGFGGRACIFVSEVKLFGVLSVKNKVFLLEAV